MSLMRTASSLVLAIILAGCVPAPLLLEVNGDVTLDGKPVGTGTDAKIRFDPLDATGNTAETFLTAGKYAARLVPGQYKVSVTWNRPTGRTVKGLPAGPGEDADEIETLVPGRYNTTSELCGPRFGTIA